MTLFSVNGARSMMRHSMIIMGILKTTACASPRDNVSPMVIVECTR